MRTLSLICCLLLFVGTATSAHAQRKAGRNGGAFLEIGVGAREVAMGSAATTITNEANQIFWNPAGTALDADRRVSVALSYNDWIADLSYTGAAVGYNIDGVGTITAGIQVFGLSDIPADRENGYTDPTLQDLVTDPNTSPTFDYQDLAFSVSFSRYFVDRLTLGSTVKVVNESIDGVNATAVAFDFGSVYKIGVAGWQIAARLNNLGSPLTFYNQDNPLPLNFSIGTSFYPVDTEQASVLLAVDATKPQDSKQLFFAGTEVSLYDLLMLRAGYKFNYAGTEDDGTSRRDAIDTTIEGISLGVGIQYVISGYAVAIDYAFTQMDLLNNVNRLTLRVGM
jgi:hypothetical protein